MSELSHDAIKKHVRIYIGVFVTLAILTIVTVAVSYLHLAVLPAILVALAIATVKSSLVASFFMHLRWERKIIFWLLLIAAVFFLVLLLLPTIASN